MLPGALHIAYTSLRVTNSIPSLLARPLSPLPCLAPPNTIGQTLIAALGPSARCVACVRTLYVRTLQISNYIPTYLPTYLGHLQSHPGFMFVNRHVSATCARGVSSGE
jgi:hypothetical protein